MERDARTFYMNTDGGDQDNANRKMPGKENGNTLDACDQWNNQLRSCVGFLNAFKNRVF
jgi:hypothetical protein